MSQTTVSRREIVRAGAAAVAVGLAGCSGGSDGTDTPADSGESGGESTPSAMASESSGSGGGGESGAGSGSSGGASASFDGWLSDVDNYDGVVDETGSDAVTVEVGVQNGAGAYGFGPAAVRVSTGTTVTFEWTGKGASHNVVQKGGGFESELTAEEGHTFEQTFDSAGTVKYLCRPHEPMGMKGVVIVE
ncbi:halocyanin domain-containing protein [Halobaculum sp. MBLA0147]|uniref:halocyanin domain-containing protein n=1 Tax=Halobaculum sp. MBLA0147 TaxID=3079934 RepID=UPI00352454B2